jgi:PadR family transcriptional regulator, regulatory protein PadR
MVRANKEMSKGTHEIMILKMLSRQNMYGYQIISEMERLSNYVFSISQGSLYPVLHAFEKNGYIKSYWENTDSARKRRYYQITEDGRVYLRKKEAEWETVIRAVSKVLQGGETYA